MVVGPIGMYFVTVNSGGMSFFHQTSNFSLFETLTRIASPTVAGLTAAITANLVLFGYIYVAWLDDREEREAASKRNEKKAQ